MLCLRSRLILFILRLVILNLRGLAVLLFIVGFLSLILLFLGLGCRAVLNLLIARGKVSVKALDLVLLSDDVKNYVELAVLKRGTRLFIYVAVLIQNFGNLFICHSQIGGNILNLVFYHIILLPVRL